MEQKCIYCGTPNDLSESDIIPDALTNARIFNRNVCRVTHNNRFSDQFESKVITALAFITNELDVKSSKGKYYAAYEAVVSIEGQEYHTSLRGDKALFDGRVLKSPDEKHIISTYDKIVKIAKDVNLVQPLDINQIKIEKSVSINTAIYFDVSMYRMIAKIAYEWYCAKNGVSGYHPEFEGIVSYITTGTGDCPVSIIQTVELYQTISEQLNLGSHALFAYESESGQIEVIVSLFGVLMYRVLITSQRPEFCSKNFLFVELRTDATRKEVEHESRGAAETHFSEFFSPDRFTVGGTINGMQVMIPRRLDCSTDIPIYAFLFSMINCFDKVRDDTQNPNDKVNQILLTQLQQIIQASLLHKKSIKRFVGDYFGAKHEPIILNPRTMNKKLTIQFFTVFAIGQSGIESLDDSGFQRILKDNFDLGGDNVITLTDDLERQLRERMVTTPAYSDILEQGAEIIKKWV